MSVYQIVYDNLEATDEELMLLIGAGSVETAIAKRIRVQEFLLNNKWDIETFNQWLMQRQSLPSMKRQITEAIKSAAVILTTELKLADNHEARIALCESCPELREDFRCPLCGCFMKVKSKYEAMHCPIGRW